MSMTFSQAEDALATGDYTTVASIKGLIEQVSGAVTGATSQTTYLLNSGVMPDGTPSFETLLEIQEAGGGVGVAKSEVGKLVMTDNSGMTRAMRMTAPSHEERNEMAYVVEKITPEDQQKILRDAACDPKKLNWLICNQYFEHPNRTWAVDRANNSYIFWAPTMREFSGDSHFYFYLHQSLVEIHLEGLFGNCVNFDDPIPSGSSPDEIRSMLSEALPIYGRFGQGGGSLTEAVAPEFCGKE